MAAWKAVLWIPGILAAMAAFCALAIWIERKFPGKKYDERQQAARGRAYRVGFLTGEAFFLAAAVWQIFQVGAEKSGPEVYLVLFAGLLLQTMLFHTYCLLSGAALPLGENPLLTIVGCLICALLYGIKWIRDPVAVLELNGQASARWIDLLVMIAFLYLALTHLIRLLRREKE